MTKIREMLDKFQGRPWFTGKRNSVLTNQMMGRSMNLNVPREVAILLNLPNPENFTFHSYRRTSATNTADAWATTEQMVDLFGWKNGTMCQEYISTSKPAILGMAKKLAGPGKKTKAQGDTNISNQDPEMYNMAGIPYTSNTPNILDQQVETAVKQALSAVPAGNGGNLSVKVVVINNMNNMSGTINL